MLKRNPASILVVVAALLVVVTQPADAQQRQALRWTTTPVGSHGYKAGMALAKVAEQALGVDYAVSVTPYTSPVVAMKAVMAGEGEIAFSADIAMGELRDRVGGFRNYQPAMPALTHTWYAYPIQSMMAVAAKNADRFKCWKDFSGKPVFFTPISFQNWLNFQRIFKVLGYDFNHVPVSLRSNAEALEAGTVVGSVAFTTAGRDLARYWQETALKLDLKVINPCADEVTKLRAAGLVVEDVDPKLTFGKDVGPKTLQGVSILFGYNARLDIPRDLIYRLTETFYEKRNGLAKIEPMLEGMAKDFIAVQQQGIKANPTLPVHPGVARFLMEHKAWDDSWIVGDGKS